MTRLAWGSAAVAVVALAFAVGRFTAPVQVEERTIEVVKRAVITVTRVKTDTQTATKTVERVVYAPGGTVTIDRVIEAKTETHVEDTSHVAEKTDAHAERVVTPKLPDWRVSALVGTGLPLVPIYGAHVERRILGPISLGAWGLSSGVVGLSVGVEF